ncbi:MAG: nucleotidyltransferase [Planctomycetes bacterium]|nr:nucleotidyltransferase [Planctomycetota bacterium]
MLNRLQDVFRSFARHDVRYVVIGGIASVLHGVPRATFDLDILIEATPDNAARLLEALEDAGLGTAALTTAEEVLTNEITVFEDRVRIDVQTSTPGLVFQDAWARRETVSYQGQTFFVLSREDLIASKRAAGREVDLEDVRLLDLPDTGDAGPEAAPDDA